MQPSSLPEISDGWVSYAEAICSPNQDERPPGLPVSLVVIHAISLPPGQFGSHNIIDLFSNCLSPDAHPYFRDISQLRVSSHFLIRRDGQLLQFVSCDKRAWHAGLSIWHGRPRCNDYSVGIELEGCDTLPFENAQYVQLARLIRTLCAYYPIDSIAGHSDISPGRKTDPGPYFEWQRFSEFGGHLRNVSE